MVKPPSSSRANPLLIMFIHIEVERWAIIGGAHISRQCQMW